MEAVWQYSFCHRHSTVTVHVRRLRAKIEAEPSAPRWLQTVWESDTASSREGTRGFVTAMRDLVTAIRGSLS